MTALKPQIQRMNKSEALKQKEALRSGRFFVGVHLANCEQTNSNDNKDDDYRHTAFITMQNIIWTIHSF